jgi:hypothetical protein
MKTWQIVGTLRSPDDATPEDVKRVLLHCIYQLKLHELYVLEEEPTSSTARK